MPGVIVSVPKGPFLRHVGMVSHNSSGGMPMVFASSPFTDGADEVTWWDFSDGQQVRVDGYPSNLLPEEVMQCAMELVGRLRYDAGTANCEHYVTRCHGYEPHSPTLRAWFALGIIAFGAIALAKAT